MERFLCMWKALILGLSVALTSTLTPAVSEQDLQPCLTQEKNLQMDCIFVLSNSTTQSHCQFLQDGKLLGSTDPGDLLIPEMSKQINVMWHQPNVCRLTVANITEKASTYTCQLRQSDMQKKSMALHIKTLPPCSAADFVFQGKPSLLLTVISLPVLLGPLIAY
ncbi:hypothetical protein Z043_108385 [Scleropages formosus]|uniref:Uncharacterized protein n=1 Tax=Scleropages formosus TaxID=113540 RepID=A0A0N8K0N0_SCLFO|nr:hypothetical protein Z043_108385 [Scleropages formosus]